MIYYLVQPKRLNDLYFFHFNPAQIPTDHQTTLIMHK